MRNRPRTVAVIAAAIVVACSGQSQPPPTPCTPASGCVRADDACRCLEWEIVSIEPIPVRYVVVGVVYAPLGNQSSFMYGHGEFYDLRAHSAASDLGARWRSVVRAADGRETVATIGPTQPAQFMWQLHRVTDTTAALALPSSAWIGVSNGVDVQPGNADAFYVWINPAAAVVTNAAGEKSISWSWTKECSYPSGCDGATVFAFSAAWLDGTAVPPNPYVQAMLDAFTAGDRAAILAYDPRFNPPGRDPSTITADARLRVAGRVHINSLGNLYLSPLQSQWMPCATVLTDDSFAPLARTEIAFGAGDTLVLQHSVLSTSASCASQQPGMYLQTSTPGCEIATDIFVDTMFGTLLMVPSSVTAECTAPQ